MEAVLENEHLPPGLELLDERVDAEVRCSHLQVRHCPGGAAAQRNPTGIPPTSEKGDQ